jgi:cytochrome b561/polyisoprenoid-binding protein YceI
MPGADLTYTPVARILHWLTALAVLGLIGLGLWMVGLPIGLTKLYAFAWHKWIGLTVLTLTVLRWVWRTAHPPPVLPATVTPWERSLAPWAHILLLILLLALPISGWLMSSAGGVKVIWFGTLPMPDLVARDMNLFETLRTLHHWLAWTLMGVLVVHVGAVVRHDLLRRDGIFRRMSPFVLLLVIMTVARPVMAQSSWTIDPAKSRIGFTVEQTGKLVSGRIATWTGTIVLEPSDLANARLDIRMDMRSASAGTKDIDDVMLGPNFLDAAHANEARFTSTSVSRRGDDYVAQGKLTIRGVTRDVALPFSLKIQDGHATARGRLAIKRLDYGVGRNEWAAITYVADDVTIDITVAASRP